MANVSYLKIFSFTFSLNLVLRKIPNSVSNYLPSCLSKFDSLSFTFNFVLSKLSMLSCVFVLNLLRKRQYLFELKLLSSFLWQFLSAEDSLKGRKFLHSLWKTQPKAISQKVSGFGHFTPSETCICWITAINKVILYKFLRFFTHRLTLQTITHGWIWAYAKGLTFTDLLYTHNIKTPKFMISCCELRWS